MAPAPRARARFGQHALSPTTPTLPPDDCRTPQGAPSVGSRDGMHPRRVHPGRQAA